MCPEEIRSNGCQESVSVEELSITPNNFFNDSINIHTYIHLYKRTPWYSGCGSGLEYYIGDAAAIEMNQFITKCRVT